MPGAPQPVEIGDVVGLIGSRPRFIIREILPDGKHAVCERAVFAGSGTFIAVPSSYYSSYILALADLEKHARAPGCQTPPGRRFKS
jgi:hypothetical protein